MLRGVGLTDPRRKLAPVPAATVVDATFDLQYDGPALAEHEMDVRDLAPALINTAELFQDLNRLVRPLDPDVAVNVRASGEGSFLVELKLVYDYTQTALLSHGVTAGESLLVLIGFVGSLVAFVRKRGRSAVVSQEEIDDPPGTVRVTFADYTSLEIPREVLDASDNIKIRRDLQEMVHPLTREGVESMTLSREHIEIGRVEKDDVPYFLAEGADERDILSSSEREVYLTIRNIAFPAGNKWRFYDGASTFYVSMKDDQFNERVDAGEPFSKQDLLHCRIREVQWRDATGLHTDVELVRVLHHIPAPMQLRLGEGQESDE
jgi:hypothetical protein